MPALTITYRIAWAAGLDAGNRSMVAGSRIAWNESDRQAAADTFAALIPSPEAYLTAVDSEIATRTAKRRHGAVGAP